MLTSAAAYLSVYPYAMISLNQTKGYLAVQQAGKWWEGIKGAL